MRACVHFDGLSYATTTQPPSSCFGDAVFRHSLLRLGFLVAVLPRVRESAQRFSLVSPSIFDHCFVMALPLSRFGSPLKSQQAKEAKKKRYSPLRAHTFLAVLLVLHSVSLSLFDFFFSFFLFFALCSLLFASSLLPVRTGEVVVCCCIYPPRCLSFASPLLPAS